MFKLLKRSGSPNPLWIVLFFLCSSTICIVSSILASLVMLLVTTLLVGCVTLILIYYIPQIIQHKFNEVLANSLAELKQTELPNGMVHKFKYTREHIYRLTVLLNEESGELIGTLAKTMNTTEDVVMSHLIALARLIYTNGLYGNPTSSGSYLGIVNPATGEATKLIVGVISENPVAPVEPIPPVKVKLTN